MTVQLQRRAGRQRWITDSDSNSVGVVEYGWGVVSAVLARVLSSYNNAMRPRPRADGINMYSAGSGDEK